MKRILMIAFHYPPFRGSSAIQRTLKFSEYLPQYGWRPFVLTAHPRAYPHTTDDQTDEITDQIVIRRAFALDSARHLSVRRRYLEWMALPDRWCTWFLGGVPRGLSMIREVRPHLLWSTSPIATAHLLGLALHRMSGVPWVADFRDPMTENHYPPERVTRSVQKWIERLTVKHCARAVFTAPGAVRKYAARYPDVQDSRWALIRNGYDERNFRRAEQLPVRRPSSGNAVRLVHSGLLYRSERDPRQFFAALGDLRREGSVSAETLRVTLRASGDEDYHRRHLRENGIEDIVFLEPPLSYHEALAEMLHADGLLVFQASNCNQQIPAKIYECLRAGRPILAMTDPHGDTAGELREAGAGTIVSLDSRTSIARGVLDFMNGVRQKSAAVAGAESIERCSRERRTRELAGLLDSIVSVAHE